MVRAIIILESNRRQRTIRGADEMERLGLDPQHFGTYTRRPVRHYGFFEADVQLGDNKYITKPVFVVSRLRRKVGHAEHVSHNYPLHYMATELGNELLLHTRYKHQSMPELRLWQADRPRRQTLEKLSNQLNMYFQTFGTDKWRCWPDGDPAEALNHCEDCNRYYSNLMAFIQMGEE